jgi:hypothetical protein
VWGLVIASGVCGLLFGRYFRIYALIPALLVIAGIACCLASKQGLVSGVLLYWPQLPCSCATCCRLLSRSSWITSSPPKRPQKNFSSCTENGSGQKAASVDGLWCPPLATAFRAGWGIDFAVGLHWLLYLGKSGPIACRTFILGRLGGWPFHSNLSERGAGSWGFAVWQAHCLSGRDSIGHGGRSLTESGHWATRTSNCSQDCNGDYNACHRVTNGRVTAVPA